MAEPQPLETRPLFRWLNRRVEKHGLLPRYAATVIAVLWLIAIVGFGVVQHFVNPDAYPTVWRGMWWATQTVTTVGYGDAVPSDTGGYVIAAVLMVAGLSLFAVVTGAITSIFVARAQRMQSVEVDAPVIATLEELSHEVARLREELERAQVDRN